MARSALGGEDAAWLHLDRSNNPVVVNVLVELAARLPVERASRLFDRLAELPSFRSILVEPSWLVGKPWWARATAFDVAQHVEHVELADAGDAGLQNFVASAAGESLPFGRPLWKVYVIDRPAAGTALLFRVHHCVADGFALLGALSALVDVDDEGHRVAEAVALPSERLRATPAMPAGVSSAVRAMSRLLALSSEPKTVLSTALAGEKRVAWSRLFPLADIKTIAHAADATVNDVLVSMVAGALRRYFEALGQATSGIELHAAVPVNLRSRAEIQQLSSELGNRFGVVFLGLPIGVEDPFARLVAVRQRMRSLKHGPDALLTHALLEAAGWTPKKVEGWAVDFFTHKASLILTNVPGPKAPVSLAGIPVSRVMYWVPQVGAIGLGISIFSYAGSVTVGVLSDAAVVPCPDVFIANIDAELAALAVIAENHVSWQGVHQRPGEASWDGRAT